MDEAKLVERLHELADVESEPGRAIRAGCKRSNPVADDDTCVRAAERQELIEILREQPEFYGGRLKMWGEKSSLYSLYETELPDALLRQARAEGPDAVQLLRDVLALEEAEFFRVVPVWGLRVEKPTWIADDVCIAPMHAVPSSPPYRYFHRDHRASFIDHFFAIQPPQVAMIASFRTKPFVITNGYVPPPPERQAAIVVVTEFMTDAIHVVADVIRAAILRRRLLSEVDWFREEMDGGIAVSKPDLLADQRGGC